jgi:hypothetical protein
MPDIFEILEKAKGTQSPRQRLAAQDRELAEYERQSTSKILPNRKISPPPQPRQPRTTKRKTPTSGVTPKSKKPKDKTPTAKKPKDKKPKASKLKTPKGAVGSKVGETYAQSADRVATSVRARAGGAGRVRAGNALGRSTGKHTPQKKQQKIKIKSIDEIQGFLQGMNHVIKREEGFKTRVTGTNLDTKMRQQKQEGKIRDKPKEVKTGNNFNLQTRIGDAAEKSVCPLIKTELNGAFNNLLDQYQSKYKSIFDEQVANRGNPKAYPKITNTGRTGKGSLGGDTQKKPKAIGESKEDQQVMQS